MKLDYIILIGILLLSCYVFGFCQGHDVGRTQQYQIDAIEMMDNILNMEVK